LQGYIFDRELKVAPKSWNTKETHARDACKRVSEMATSIYGSGHTIATAIREARQEVMFEKSKKRIKEI
jgi:hypothetical protein